MDNSKLPAEPHDTNSSETKAKAENEPKESEAKSEEPQRSEDIAKEYTRSKKKLTDVDCTITFYEVMSNNPNIPVKRAEDEYTSELGYITETLESIERKANRISK